MNFEEQFVGEPVSLEPTLSLIIQEDKMSIAGAKSLRFEVLVKFFDRFSNMRGVKKSNYVKQFLKILLKADRSPSFVYPIIRLLLPAEDKDRGNYGLKEKNLSKVIADSLSLSKEDYLRLHHYKNPSFHKNGVGIGDFSLCVFDVVKSYCKQRSVLTVAQLNEMLDELVSSTRNHITVFRRLFMTCTAEEIKWIVRIILKDLKISIKIDTVLNTFHADATDFFNLTNSLLQTCKKFQDPSVSLDDEIKIFFPIRPMLAGKKKINYFNEGAKKMYYVETKFDGERLQVHKKGSEVKLFSRNAVDYSNLYSQFIEVIRNHVNADECILDGEIIVVERGSLKMVPFGLNKVVALDKDNTEQRLCYKIFDLLWLKEENEEINLMKYPLKQRKGILAKIVKQEAGVIETVKHQELSEYDDIVKRFSESLDNNQEGIMLKDPDSLYFPKERGSNWIKLKGDYIDGLTDTLDLIILGGYFGDSTARYGPSKHWSDQITSFLIGVIDRIDPLNPQIAYAIPFAKVGTGYSIDELNRLRSRLKDNLSKNEAKFKPPYLDGKWKPGLQDRPDCWITTLSRSVVLEVKAAELIVSDSYPTAHTLRFPRVVKIRYDKDWNEAETMKDLQELTNASLYGKNLKRRLDDSDSDNQKDRQVEDKTGKKKVKREREVKKEGVYQEYLGFDMTNQRIISHLFSGFQFCVFSLSNSKQEKGQIEREIMLHDGQVVQNPLPSTQYIVADVIDFKLRAYQTQKGKEYTFVKPNYVINCIKANKILSLTPLYLTVLPEGNSKYYLDNFDRFGDSYTTFLDVRELDQILERMGGGYTENQKLMDRICIKKRRSGKVSMCFGVSELNKVKLRMQDNVLVLSFQQKPNSVIVDGDLLPYEVTAINHYMEAGNELLIEYVDELTAIDIL